MIYSLQAYRGIAALLVLFLHANSFMGSYFGQNEITNFFRFGHAGVQFFFVLSGFIIYHTHKSDAGVRKSFGTFIKKRFVRIFPLYWIATFLTLVIPGFKDDSYRKVLPLIKSLLLFPYNHELHVDVAWALILEVIFYVLFALVILNKKAGSIIFVIWQLSTLISQYIFPKKIVLHFWFLFSPNNLLFGLGFIAGYLNEEFEILIKKYGLWIFASGSLMFLLTGLSESFAKNLTISMSYTFYILLFGVSSFLIVLGSRNSAVESLFSKKNTMLLIGNASYSIYLFHMHGLYVSTTILNLRMFEFIPITAKFFIIISMTLISGILFNRIVEVPLLSGLRKKWI